MVAPLFVTIAVGDVKFVNVAVATVNFNHDVVVVLELGDASPVVNRKSPFCICHIYDRVLAVFAGTFNCVNCVPSQYKNVEVTGERLVDIRHLPFGSAILAPWLLSAICV